MKTYFALPCGLVGALAAFATGRVTTGQSCPLRTFHVATSLSCPTRSIGFSSICDKADAFTLDAVGGDTLGRPNKGLVGSDMLVPPKPGTAFGTDRLCSCARRSTKNCLREMEPSAGSNKRTSW